VSQLKKDPKLLVLAVAGGVVLVLAVAWFLLIAPKKDEASQLDTQIAAKQTELAEKKAALAQPSAAVKVRASDLFRLTKALPDETDMAGVILDVNRIASANKLSFSAISPTPAIQGTGSISVPVTLTVQGRYASVSKFVGDLRRLVKVRGNGLLDARGRTYSVASIDLGTPDDANFPNVKATVTLNAYSFVPNSPTAPTDPNAAPTTTPTSTSGTVAAGVTP
jgi:Tfp pilus assembly protein PilO